MMSGRAAFFRSIEDPEGTHKREIEGKGSVHTTGPLIIHVAGAKAWAEGPALVWIRSGQGYGVYALVQPLGPAEERRALGDRPLPWDCRVLAQRVTVTVTFS